MRNDFEQVLDECLARLMSGESLDEVLKPYPDMAAKLRPLLAAALQVSSLPHPQPRPEAVAAGQARMLQAFQKRQAEPVPGGPVPGEPGPGGLPALGTRVVRWLENLIPQQNFVPVFRLAVLALVVLAIFTPPLAITASATSLPGDTLYLVKRSWERVQLTFTINQQARTNLQEQFQENRQEEIQTLVAKGREEKVDFGGIVETMQDPNWVVAGIQVQVSDDTEVTGHAEVGGQVNVVAEVHADGALEAVRVQVLDDEGPKKPPSPSETATATSTDTATPMETGTAAPTLTDTPDDTSTPTSEPAATPAPKDRHEPKPTKTEKAHPGGRPTDPPARTPPPHPTHETGRPTDRPGNRPNSGPPLTPTP